MDGCEDNEILCHLVHALYINENCSGKHKSDVVYASDIADLLREGTFPLAYCYPREMRAARDLQRWRQQLVIKRASLYSHINNVCCK